MNRRDFLKSSGALVVSFSHARSRVRAGPPQPGRFDGPGTPQLDSWLAIGADGNVTAYTGKVELGHGLYTSQTQLVAEELCVPLSRVKLIQGDTGVAPDQGTTSGSQSHPVNFNDGGLAQAPRDGARSASADGGAAHGRSRDAPSRGRRRHQRCRPSQPHLCRTDRRKESSTSRSTRTRSGSPPANGRFSASRSHGSTSRRSRRGSSSSCTTSASPACCTAASSVRRKSARRS